MIHKNICEYVKRTSLMHVTLMFVNTKKDENTVKHECTKEIVPYNSIFFVLRSSKSSSILYNQLLWSAKHQLIVQQFPQYYASPFRNSALIILYKVFPQCVSSMLVCFSGHLGGRMQSQWQNNYKPRLTSVVNSASAPPASLFRSSL